VVIVTVTGTGDRGFESRQGVKCIILIRTLKIPGNVNSRSFFLLPNFMDCTKQFYAMQRSIADPTIACFVLSCIFQVVIQYIFKTLKVTSHKFELTSKVLYLCILYPECENVEKITFILFSVIEYRFL
jgi:hypothetical protein